MALETGDAATWGGTVVTFGMACYAIAQGVGQRRDLRRQNELQAEASQLQRRQIEAAERHTLAMEQLLGQLTAASRQGTPVPAAEPPAWQSVPPLPPAQRPVPPPPPLSRPAPEETPSAEDAWEDEREEPAEPSSGREPGGPAAPPEHRPQPDPYGSPVPAGPPVSAGPPTTPAYGFPQQGGYAAPQVQQPGAAPWGAGPAPFPPVPPWTPAGIWRVERVGRHGFALRNTGTETRTGVRVSRVNLPSSARGVPEDAVVRPGESAEFLMAAERGQPVPGAVLVSWHGQPGEVGVPVPQG
ncbi:hypothetical protein DB35_06355 [Streptomyces abyssalis]|uniref:Uncharacterized protein n=1 Tax=Streptomyces abyssalis TaxID=933944 RepID=A0A1E7JT24_9ACTN|nr:hypothetical protein AN215_06400 [Streptomyces abyssalis]OEU94665.1 hypothetical protein DB35_06355 [Streptomyces abyssalis]